ncbi:MAG: 50S ribosomal protein L6 [Zetaproteobacteria bacterium]|nr:50S ribosomal protein L6 [Zetaproteobacteria bacterium]
MSRIGKKLIAVPSSVKVQITGQTVKVEGPKGKLERSIHSSMSLVMEENNLRVVPKNGPDKDKNFFGLTRSLVANMVQGCSEGYSKKLLLRGVGYRGTVKGNQLNLVLGYSHPVIYDLPAGIEAKVEKSGKDPMVVISGFDKELVGQVAANVRGFRPPEPYHGKGVRYFDEVIITKVGKSAGKK